MEAKSSDGEPRPGSESSEQLRERFGRSLLDRHAFFPGTHSAVREIARRFSWFSADRFPLPGQLQKRWSVGGGAYPWVDLHWLQSMGAGQRKQERFSPMSGKSASSGSVAVHGAALSQSADDQALSGAAGPKTRIVAEVPSATAFREAGRRIDLAETASPRLGSDADGARPRFPGAAGSLGEERVFGAHGSTTNQIGRAAAGADPRGGRDEREIARDPASDTTSLKGAAARAGVRARGDSLPREIFKGRAPVVGPGLGAGSNPLLRVAELAAGSESSGELVHRSRAEHASEVAMKEAEPRVSLDRVPENPASAHFQVGPPIVQRSLGSQTSRSKPAGGEIARVFAPGSESVQDSQIMASQSEEGGASSPAPGIDHNLLSRETGPAGMRVTVSDRPVHSGGEAAPLARSREVSMSEIPSANAKSASDVERNTMPANTAVVAPDSPNLPNAIQSAITHAGLGRSAQQVVRQTSLPSVREADRSLHSLGLSGAADVPADRVARSAAAAHTKKSGPSLAERNPSNASTMFQQDVGAEVSRRLLHVTISRKTEPPASIKANHFDLPATASPRTLPLVSPTRDQPAGGSGEQNRGGYTDALRTADGATPATANASSNPSLFREVANPSPADRSAIHGQPAMRSVPQNAQTSFARMLHRAESGSYSEAGGAVQNRVMASRAEAMGSYPAEAPPIKPTSPCGVSVDQPHRSDLGYEHPQVRSGPTAAAGTLVQSAGNAAQPEDFAAARVASEEIMRAGHGASSQQFTMRAETSASPTATPLLPRPPRFLLTSSHSLASGYERLPMAGPAQSWRLIHRLAVATDRGLVAAGENRPQVESLVRRSAVPQSAPNAILSGAGSSSRLPSLPATASAGSQTSQTSSTPANVDIRQLANRVYDLLVRRLASERQRQGR